MFLVLCLLLSLFWFCKKKTVQEFAILKKIKNGFLLRTIIKWIRLTYFYFLIRYKIWEHNLNCQKYLSLYPSPNIQHTFRCNMYINIIWLYYTTAFYIIYYIGIRSKWPVFGHFDQCWQYRGHYDRDILTGDILTWIFLYVFNSFSFPRCRSWHWWSWCNFWWLGWIHWTQNGYKHAFWRNKFQILVKRYIRAITMWKDHFSRCRSPLPLTFV